MSLYNDAALEVTDRILEQGKALVRAIEALGTIELSGAVTPLGAPQLGVPLISRPLDGFHQT